MLSSIMQLVDIYKNNPEDRRLNVDEYLRIIRYLDMNGDRDGAINLSGYYAGRYHNNVLCSALMTKGMLAYAEKRYEDAIEIFTDVIEIDPGSAHAYSVRGICYAQSNREGAVQLAVDDHVKAGQIIEFAQGEQV